MNNVDGKIQKWRNQKPNKDLSGCILSFILCLLFLFGIVLSLWVWADNSKEFVETGKDWATPEQHLFESEQTLQQLDQGVYEVEKRLEKIQSVGNFVKLHELRLHYLQTRVQLLYHIRNVSPPYDLTVTEEPEQETE